MSVKCTVCPPTFPSSEGVLGLEFLHEGDEGEHAFKRHRIAERDAAPTDPGVTLEPDQATPRLSLLVKLSFQARVTLADPESDVYARSILHIDPVAVV